MNETKYIEAARHGDEAAYHYLAGRYYRGLVYHLTAMVHDADAAEDLAQEAFIKAYLHLGRYDATYKFSTWLYRIGTNLALNYVKRRRHVSLDTVPDLPTPEINTVLEAEDQQELDAKIKALQRAVARLPLNYQTVISLYYWRECTYADIAFVMNVPVNTVRTWLRRAKQALKESL